MGVPDPRYPAEMDTAPLCSIGVSSWSDRDAEAAFDMIASGTQRSRRVVALYPGDAAGDVQPTSQEDAKPWQKRCRFRPPFA